MKTKLSVNLNKVALLRNQRDLLYPSVTNIARIVIAAGAEGITVHPRPDERHIRPSDVRDLSGLLKSEYNNKVEFNIEGYPTNAFLELVREVKPTQVTLVPDAPDQRTSDHGWDISTEREFLQSVVAQIHETGARVSLFIDAESEEIPQVSNIRAERIELYTEPYARAYATGDFEDELDRYSATAQAAVELGIGVNAGHDLTLDNLPPFKQRIPMLAEVSIGHAITADALVLGFTAAVKAYKAALA